ncbi:MAG: hypothetical protein HZA50_01535 [Planctomycetes bacterium]|nr:hypothetical protein [Planctomycetota bacterium]
MEAADIALINRPPGVLFSAAAWRNLPRGNSTTSLRQLYRQGDFPLGLAHLLAPSGKAWRIFLAKRSPLGSKDNDG